MSRILGSGSRIGSDESDPGVEADECRIVLILVIILILGVVVSIVIIVVVLLVIEIVDVKLVSPLFWSFSTSSWSLSWSTLKSISSSLDNFPAPFLAYTPDFSIIYYNFLSTTACSNTVTLSQLTSDRLHHNFQPASSPVKSMCGAVQSAPSPVNSGCGAVQPAPYSDNFTTLSNASSP